MPVRSRSRPPCARALLALPAGYQARPSRGEGGCSNPRCMLNGKSDESIEVSWTAEEMLRAVEAKTGRSRRASFEFVRAVLAEQAVLVAFRLTPPPAGPGR
jgi:hypothetical protein